MAKELTEELSGILAKAVGVVYDPHNPRLYASDGKVFYEHQSVFVFSPDRVNRGSTTINHIDGDVLHLSYIPVGTAPGDFLVVDGPTFLDKLEEGMTAPKFLTVDAVALEFLLSDEYLACTNARAALVAFGEFLLERVNGRA